MKTKTIIRDAVAIAAVALLGARCSAPEARSAAPAASGATVTEAPAPAATIAAGQQQYQARCAFCHGESGAGDTPMVAGFPNANLADGIFAHGSTRAEIARSIANGVPDTPMQSFAGTMTPQEIDAAAAYVQSLGRK